MNVLKVTEKQTQNLILEWLSLKRIFHYRNNTGGFRDKNDHFYRFGMLGSPDIVVVYKGKYVAIEVKGPKGKQRDTQKQFQEDLEKAGGIYILARSLEDVEEGLNSV